MSRIGEPPQPSQAADIALTKCMLLCTLFASFFFAWESLATFWEEIRTGDLLQAGALGTFIAITFFLIYGNIVYQCARIGHLKRAQAHVPLSPGTLDAFLYGSDVPSVTMLVPSYKEEEQVVWQTLMSAALQEYPRKRIVLLIDDAPSPRTLDDQASLSAALRLPNKIQDLLSGPRRELQVAADAFEERRRFGRLDAGSETRALAELCRRVSRWYAGQADACPVRNHTDAFFVEKILRAPAERFGEKAERLEESATALSLDQLSLEHRRLASLFYAELTGFQRKRFVNLSHEPNKAMNLNSYLGLLGKRLLQTRRADGLHLEEAEHGKPVPDADFVLTLDADSLLLPDYAARLMEVMMRPGNERLAVIQTPYSAVPGAPALIERTAGATTDIQHIIHQGSTHYDGTFWVGANALLRKSALDDICELDRERGHAVRRYIQDRTVIEDTESTVDLIAKGWRLFNYPDRLSYSATPPDYGSLLIQRRRWANGGLIILPKLLRYLAKGVKERTVGEAFLRSHYLASITGVNIGLLLLLVVPFESCMRSLWLPLTALPYYFLYGRDLVQLGYRARDLARVYALNLLLIPVNLGGVFKSIQQGVTRKKIPFGRTPKVQGRTSAPACYIACEYLLFAYVAFAFFMDLGQGRWVHASFSLVNAGFLFYAISAFMDWGASSEDLWRQVRALSFFERPQDAPAQEGAPAFVPSPAPWHEDFAPEGVTVNVNRTPDASDHSVRAAG